MPVGIIRDNITHLDTDKLDNIVNSDIKKLIDTAKSVIEKDTKYYRTRYLLIGDL